MTATADTDSVRQALQESMREAMARCREWLQGHGIVDLRDPLDGAAARAVLEESMRASIAKRLEVSDLTVQVGEVEDGTAARWYLSLFGMGIWYEQFEVSVLMSGEASTEEGCS